MTDGMSNGSRGASPLPSVIVRGRLGRTPSLAAAFMVATVVSSAALLQVYYAERVYPRVRVADTPLGGLALSGAEERLRPALPRQTEESVTLLDPVDGRQWTFSADELGLPRTAAALAAEAYAVGREGGLVWRLASRLGALLAGHDVLGPDLLNRDRAAVALQQLAPEVDVAPQDADLTVVDRKLVLREPVLGHQLDVPGTLARLELLAANPLSTSVSIATLPTAPRINDLTDVGRAYRRIVSGPMQLAWQDNLLVPIDLDLIESWVDIRPVRNPDGVEMPTIVFDTTAMSEWVAPLAAHTDRLARGARFELDPTGGAVRVYEPGRVGLRLDVAGTVQRIMDAAYSTERATSPVIQTIAPAVAASDAALFADLDELSRSSVSLRDSPPGVLQNVLLAVEQVHGVALAPGKSFSLNAQLGEVSAATGYDMIAVEGAALASTSGGNGLGGGLVHAATCAFRAAFWAGLPIDERHAPPYRLGWVEPPVGLDAAVDVSQRDLAFSNDTPGYVLLQVRIDLGRQALSCTIHGHSDGRRVELRGPIVSDVQPAPPAIERSDARLAPGEYRQVAWAREGAQVYLERLVHLREAATRSDRFDARYEPASDVVVVGPGP